jgi:hypothetical protein
MVCEDKKTAAPFIVFDVFHLDDWLGDRRIEK